MLREIDEDVSFPRVSDTEFTDPQNPLTGAVTGDICPLKAEL